MKRGCERRLSQRASILRKAIHNALGRTDKALDLLERAYEERDVRMAFLKTDARWNNLRTHPRFIALMRKMRYPDPPG